MIDLKQGNCFSQNADFTTNYDALNECLDKYLKGGIDYGAFQGLCND